MRDVEYINYRHPPKDVTSREGLPVITLVLLIKKLKSTEMNNMFKVSR